MIRYRRSGGEPVIAAESGLSRADAAKRLKALREEIEDGELGEGTVRHRDPLVRRPAVVRPARRAIVTTRQHLRCRPPTDGRDGPRSEPPTPELLRQLVRQMRDGMKDRLAPRALRHRGEGRARVEPR